MVALPLGAVGGGLVEYVLRSHAIGAALLAAVLGAAAVFVAWALGRELAPGAHATAFLTLAAGFTTHQVIADATLLPPVTAVALTRLVNRTAGPAPSTLDSVAVLGLVGWAAVSTGHRSILVVGALAFAVDAFLDGGQKRQWGFSALALVAATVWTGPFGIPPSPVPRTFDVTTLAVSVVILAAFGLAILRTRVDDTGSDLDGAPLTPTRVQAGMALALLLAAASFSGGADGVREGSVLWAVLAATVTGSLIRWPALERRLRPQVP